MNDFVINVRQIMEYPLKGEASEADAVLLQTGALGGPYAWTTTYGLVTGALNWPGAKLGVGRVVPVDAAAAQVFTDDFIVPVGGGIWFNRYTDFNGMGRYWETGPAGIFGFNAGGGIQFDPFPPGPGGSLTPVGLSVWSVGPDGYMIAADTLLVGRDPTAPLEVATKGYVDRDIDELSDRIQQIINNSVWSFNGRTGNVTLFLSDILSAGGAPIESPSFNGLPTAPTALPGGPGDQIATLDFVRYAVSQAGLVGPPGPPGVPGPPGQPGGASVGAMPPAIPYLGNLWGDDYWWTLSFWDGDAWRRLPQINLQDNVAGTGAGDLQAWAVGVDTLEETYARFNLAAYYQSNATPLYDPVNNAAEGTRGCFWWVPGTGQLRLNVGTGVSPDWRSINSGVSAGTVTFLTSGIYTPIAGLLFAVVECIGGGGGGGNINVGAGATGGSGGGGSGGYSRSVLTAAQIGSSQFVNVGVGGLATTGGANGGTSTSFGNLVIALGGSAGEPFASDVQYPGGPGAGAPLGTGQVTLEGGNGVWSTSTAGTFPVLVASAGGIIWGGGGPTPALSVPANWSGGNPGTSNSGAGGTGAITWNVGNAAILSGGDGGSGICIITEYYR